MIKTIVSVLIPTWGMVHRLCIFNVTKSKFDTYQWLLRAENGTRDLATIWHYRTIISEFEPVIRAESFQLGRTLHSDELEADATERQHRSGRVKLQLQCFVRVTRYFYNPHSQLWATPLLASNQPRHNILTNANWFKVCYFGLYTFGFKSILLV